MRAPAQSCCPLKLDRETHRKRANITNCLNTTSKLKRWRWSLQCYWETHFNSYSMIRWFNAQLCDIVFRNSWLFLLCSFHLVKPISSSSVLHSSEAAAVELYVHSIHSMSIWEHCPHTQSARQRMEETQSRRGTLRHINECKMAAAWDGKVEKRDQWYVNLLLSLCYKTHAHTHILVLSNRNATNMPDNSA